jgi:hypothetical protein
LGGGVGGTHELELDNQGFTASARIDGLLIQRRKDRQYPKH